MSGSAHQKPHGRQGQPNSAWNHLQVPNYYPRQPQLAHMSSERPLSQSPMTWHTPTPLESSGKPGCPGPLFNLQQMMVTQPGTLDNIGMITRQPNPLDINIVPRDRIGQTLPLDINIVSRERIDVLTRQSSLDSFRQNPLLGSVDLSLARSTISPHSLSSSPSLSRNGQNGDSMAPLSLSIRDAKQINSMDSTEINKLQTVRPIELVRSPSICQRSESPNSPLSLPRSVVMKKVDSILERISCAPTDLGFMPKQLTSEERLEDVPQTVPLTFSSTVTTDNPMTPVNDEVLASAISNKDTVDSRRQENKVGLQHGEKVNEPSKIDNKAETCNRTSVIAVAAPVHTCLSLGVPASLEVNSDSKTSATEVKYDLSLEPIQPPKRRSSIETPHINVHKVRRKTLSESETIENISAMIASSTETKLVPDAVTVDCQSREDAGKESQRLASVLCSPESILKDHEVQSVENESPVITNVMEEKSERKVYASATKNTQEGIGNISETSSFVEVENELEKMFAGIDETTSTDKSVSVEMVTSPSNVNENVTSTSSDLINSPKGKRTKKQTNIRKSTDSNDSTAKKKPKLELVNNSKVKLIKGKNARKRRIKNLNQTKLVPVKPKSELPIDTVMIYDSGSSASSNKSRGPFVQIKGPRDSPISVNIVNTPSNEDEPDNKMKQPKGKKPVPEDKDFRQKVRSKGLHSSTLSMKYDATTTDTSWVCVFCKQGPHSGVIRNPGDLFGPYIVTTTCPEFQYSQEGPGDDPFKSKRNKSDIYRQVEQPIKKKRTSQSDVLVTDIYSGMTEAGSGAFEVWGHEDCIIWAPGVHLIGSRVVGLEGAVWGSCRAQCAGCGFTGAGVVCNSHGCAKTAHVSCALVQAWRIDEGEYKARCPNHKTT